MKIGVFDSGVGGLSVANAIRRALPELEIDYKEDHENMPYGNKTVEQIHGLVGPFFKQFMDDGCQVIVVACNTVTTNLIKQLREEFPVPMVGIEPMVKPAAENTKTGVIAVFATPLTLKSERYQWLKEHYAKGIKVLEPDASDWASMIENNKVYRDKIANRVEEALSLNADQLVLGSTHYHWIEQQIKLLADGRADVIQPEKAIVAQLKRVLEQLP
jgi:glutamate racemase